MATQVVTIEDILAAFEDFAEASGKLREMLSEYTGYSPSYHFASWYEAKDKAAEKAGKVLRDFIKQVIAEEKGGA